MCRINDRPGISVKMVCGGKEATMQKVIALVLCALLAGPRALSGQPGQATGVFQSGEELQYKVKWNFVRLGTIKIRTVTDSSVSDRSQYTIIMTVASNPVLQFIWIRERNESHMNALELYSAKFFGQYCNGEDRSEVSQRYDTATHTAFYRKSDPNSGRVLLDDTFHNAPPFVEGPSLLFAARVLSHSSGVVVLPTMVEGGIHNTVLEFNGEREIVTVGSNDQEVRTRKYNGHADWNGITSAGLGGEFTGWISDDEAAVPIKAELKVVVGSVTLELESWTRPGWMPPSGSNTAYNGQ